MKAEYYVQYANLTKGCFKQFNLLPCFTLVYDAQLKPEWYCYAIYVEWLWFQIGFHADYQTNQKFKDES